jgi:hypothetical protein
MPSSDEVLALLGGQPTVTVPHPHFVWPPKASQAELKQLAAQRDKDIRAHIKTSSGKLKYMQM